MAQRGICSELAGTAGQSSYLSSLPLPKKLQSAKASMGVLPIEQPMRVPLSPTQPPKRSRDWLLNH